MKLFFAHSVKQTDLLAMEVILKKKVLFEFLPQNN